MILFQKNSNLLNKKIIQYGLEKVIIFKKPILTINSNDATVSEITLNSDCGICSEPAPEEICQKLNLFYNYWQNDKLNEIYNPNNEYINLFDRNVLTKQLSNLMNT